MSWRTFTILWVICLVGGGAAGALFSLQQARNLSSPPPLKLIMPNDYSRVRLKIYHDRTGEWVVNFRVEN